MTSDHYGPSPLQPLFRLYAAQQQIRRAMLEAWRPFVNAVAVMAMEGGGMTEQEWLTCDDSRRMLRLATGRVSLCCGCIWCDNGDGTVSMVVGQTCCKKCDNDAPSEGYRQIGSSRKLRLFAVACCRLFNKRPERELRAWEDKGDPFGMTDFQWATEWTRVEVSERSELISDLMRHVFGNPFRPVGAVACGRCSGAGSVLTGYLCPKCEGEAVWRHGLHFDHQKRCVSSSCNQTAWEPGETIHCPTCLGRGWLHADRVTFSPTILSLASSLYAGEDCAFALHDALLEAGCNDLAAHFSGYEPGQVGFHESAATLSVQRRVEGHPKGCWALDYILGRE